MAAAGLVIVVTTNLLQALAVVADIRPLVDKIGQLGGSADTRAWLALGSGVIGLIIAFGVSKTRHHLLASTVALVLTSGVQVLVISDHRTFREIQLGCVVTLGWYAMLGWRDLHDSAAEAYGPGRWAVAMLGWRDLHYPPTEADGPEAWTAESVARATWLRPSARSVDGVSGSAAMVIDEKTGARTAEWQRWHYWAQEAWRLWNEWLAADAGRHAEVYRQYVSALAEEEHAAAEFERATARDGNRPRPS